MIYTEHEYLAHHGVDKQKWGHRNGPPYPLNPEQMTSAQKKANANEGWFKRKLREAKEAKQAKKEAKEAKKVEEKLAKQAHKQGRLSEQERKEVYDKADIKTAYQHASEYSNRDLQSIMERYEMQQALSQKVANISYKEKMKGKEKIDVAAKYLESAANIGRKAVDIYNIAAAVGNALGDKEWKPIRIGEFPKSKNKDDSRLSDDKRQQLFRDADIMEAYKYRGDLTNKDLKNIMDRKNIYDRLAKEVSGKKTTDNSRQQNVQNKNQNNKQQNNHNGQQNDQKSNKKDNNTDYKTTYDSYKNKYKNSTYEEFNKKSLDFTKEDSSKNTSSEKKSNDTKPSSTIKTQKVSSSTVKDNAKKGENWLFSSGLGGSVGYSGSNYKNDFSSNVKLDYSKNFVKDEHGNSYRMISTGGKMSDIDANYMNNGVEWLNSTGWSVDWSKK